MLMNVPGIAAVNKLKQLIASRYGKVLEIRQLMDLSSCRGENEELKGNDLHIPIESEGQFLGVAIVPQAVDLNGESRTDLANLVRMALRPTLYNWYLERKENNLLQMAQAHFEDDSLPLFEDFEDDSADFEEDEKPQLISNFVHLEGTNVIIVKKIALQLHEMTHRWAFVPFSDIRSQISSVADITKMGAMTIFIEEVNALASAEQDLLLEYLGSPRSDSEPLIITNSKMSLLEIQSSDLHPHLIDEIEVNCFEVNKAPLSYHSLREVLELFFMRDKDLI